MKQVIYYSIAALVASAIMGQQAFASPIVQVVTSGGSTGATNLTGNAVLTSFVADGVTYDSLIGIGVNDPSPAARLWANTLSDPGSDTAAVSDLDLGTGTLNNGTDAEFDLTGQTLSAATTIFMFGNGTGSVTVDGGTGNAINSGGTTPPSTITFVDAGDNPLGTVPGDVFFQDPGTNSLRAPNLMSFDFARSGNPLNGRTVSGWVFNLGDITFTSGGIGDIAGFTIATGSTDIQDVGIAFPVPEPATSTLLGIGAIATLLRRPKSVR